MSLVGSAKNVILKDSILGVLFLRLIVIPKVRDIESGHVFGSVKVPLSRILEEDREELKLPLEEHDLTSKKNEDNGGGVVKFSAKIRYTHYP